MTWWQMIFREDTVTHMTGSFFGVWVLWWIFYRIRKEYMNAALYGAIVCVFLSGANLEFIQASAHPEWFTWFDTIKDMVMNGMGITLAVVAIRRNG